MSDGLFSWKDSTGIPKAAGSISASPSTTHRQCLRARVGSSLVSVTVSTHPGGAFEHGPDSGRATSLVAEGGVCSSSRAYTVSSETIRRCSRPSTMGRPRCRIAMLSDLVRTSTSAGRVPCGSPCTVEVRPPISSSVRRTTRPDSASITRLPSSASALARAICSSFESVSAMPCSSASSCPAALDTLRLQADAGAIAAYAPSSPVAATPASIRVARSRSMRRAASVAVRQSSHSLRTARRRRLAQGLPRYRPTIEGLRALRRQCPDDTGAAGRRRRGLAKLEMTLRGIQQARRKHRGHRAAGPVRPRQHRFVYRACIRRFSALEKLDRLLK
eukprot:scaffold133834_cov32-Tisochrysis_lutea.AAC.4